MQGWNFAIWNSKIRKRHLVFPVSWQTNVIYRSTTRKAMEDMKQEDVQKLLGSFYKKNYNSGKVFTL